MADVELGRVWPRAGGLVSGVFGEAGGAIAVLGGQLVVAGVFGGWAV